MWLAHDDRLRAPVAVKVLADNWAHDPAVRERFLEEARLLRRLDSDRVVRVYAVDELDDGRPFFVMEWADGGTLEDRARARGGERLGTAEAVRVALEVLESLAVVHAMGLVHRDVKPSNVLFRSVPEHKRSGGELERVLLGDLGLAKDLTLASGFTMSAGTPAYMAPEQRGLVGMVDARADLYAVAVVLSELIVGQGRSSAGTTVGGQGTAVVADVGTRAPAGVLDAIERALATDPAARFATAGEMAAALRAGLGSTRAGPARRPSTGSGLSPTGEEARGAPGSLGREQSGSKRAEIRLRLPRTAANFTGRDDLLAELDATLKAGSRGVVTQAISGLGGVGKTQLAAAYVNAHADEFDVVAWVRAEQGGTGDLAELAVALGLPVAGRTPTERAADALAFLSNSRLRWLLVLDNVLGPEALTELPSSGEGRVLVTSRHRGGYETFGPELAVDVFDPGTARAFLLARSGRTGAEVDDAGRVAAALGYLPLALAHAGAYCHSGSGVGFGEYLELLEGLPTQDMFDSNPEIFYHHTVAATWNTSIAAAQDAAPLAAPALEMMAYLAPDAIPRPFFSVLAEQNPTGHKRVIDALTWLHRYSLVTVADHGVTVHRLLQKVIRDRLEAAGESTAGGRALAAVRAAVPGDPELPGSWPRWQELVPHVVTLANDDLVARVHTKALLEALNLTYPYLTRRSAVAAHSLAARAASIAAAGKTRDDPETLQARHNLAISYLELGRTNDAIAEQETVVADRQRILGPDHFDTLNSLNNLAGCYYYASRAEEAATIFGQVAAARERLLGGDHPKTLTARGNVAAAYNKAGRAEEAITILEQVTSQSERVQGGDHPGTLFALDELGIAYRMVGRAEEAIAILSQAARDRERIQGGDHPDSVESRKELAVSYREVGRLEESVAMLELIVADYVRLLGAGHYRTLDSQHELGVSYRAAGRAAESVAVLEQVIAERERALGKDHADTLNSRRELALSYHATAR